MAGAVAFTTLFALGGAFPIFTFAWMANRLVQSAGWSGMVKISGRWFDYRSHGTVLAILSLSYLYGDAAGKAFNGWLLNQRLGWRNVFFVDAAILGSLFLISFWLLKESPRVIGAPEGTPNPNNVYASAEDDPNQFGWLGILKPLLARPSFWFACLISLCLTFVRETFNTWNSTYFTESIRLEIGPAAYWSAAFSFLGGCSVLLAGFASDWLGRTGRAIIIFVGPLFAGIALLFLSGLDATTAAAGAIALVLIVGFFMLGPYSYLSGAVSLDFGGKRGSATACGIIDGVGYLGGILAGYAVARLVRAHGWPTTFGVLAGVTLVSCVFAALFLIAQIRQGGRAQVERDGAR
jgi:OPA family glycerol-3-phosphate transporter-like MFS transporter